MRVSRPRRISVIGSGTCDDTVRETARKLGGLLAGRGFTVVCGGLGGVMNVAARAGRVDVWQGLAEAAIQADWTRPEIRQDLSISIRAGRHPVVEAAAGAGNYIPNDVTLPEDAKVLLITGPNMATNARLKALCARQNKFVRFLDIYKPFLADDGKLGPNFTEDGIHLTKNAYSLWKKLILSQL